MKGRNWNPAALPAPLSLTEVVAAYPELTADGWPTRGGWRTRIEPEEFDLACAFIAAFGRRKRCFNNRRSSYGLKHTAESWAGDYVSNGAFTAAALAFGFRHKIDGDSPNSLFDLDLLKRERPLRVLLSIDDLSYDSAITLTLAHALADELSVPFDSLWLALGGAVRQHPSDAVALGQHLDSALRKEPGDSLAAFGRALRKAAR